MTKQEIYNTILVIAVAFLCANYSYWYLLLMILYDYKIIINTHSKTTDKKE